MNNITIAIADVEMTFDVTIHDDAGDMGTPWDNEDGHGPVTDWVRREKRPDELVLNHCVRTGQKRFYNFKEACAIALRDGWGCKDLDGAETKRQKAAKAAMADFEYLRAWCNNEWSYVGVEVTLLDSEGNKTEVSDSMWGIESHDDQVNYHAQNLADDLAHGLHMKNPMLVSDEFKVKV